MVGTKPGEMVGAIHRETVGAKRGEMVGVICWGMVGERWLCLDCQKQLELEHEGRRGETVGVI